MPFAKLSNVTLHYSDLHSSTVAAYNSSTAVERTLILVHGLGSSQNFYYPLLQLLPPIYRCIVYDQPNSARSTFFGEGTDTNDTTLAAAAGELLDYLKVTEKVTVVGHSMAGPIALHIGQQRPEQVEKIVLLGPVHPSEQLRTLFEGRIKAVREQGMEAVGNTIPHIALGAGATALQRSMVRELLMNQKPEGYVTMCNAVAKCTLGDPQKVKAPVLVIAGTADKSTPLEGCRKVTEELPDAIIRLVDGMGHWHCIEEPERTAQILGEFLE